MANKIRWSPNTTPTLMWQADKLKWLQELHAIICVLIFYCVLNNNTYPYWFIFLFSGQTSDLSIPVNLFLGVLLAPAQFCHKFFCDKRKNEKISKFVIFSFCLFCSIFSHSRFSHSRFSHTPAWRYNYQIVKYIA